MLEVGAWSFCPAPNHDDCGHRLPRAPPARPPRLDRPLVPVAAPMARAQPDHDHRHPRGLRPLLRLHHHRRTETSRSPAKSSRPQPRRCPEVFVPAVPPEAQTLGPHATVRRRREGDHEGRRRARRRRQGAALPRAGHRRRVLTDDLRRASLRAEHDPRRTRRRAALLLRRRCRDRARDLHGRLVEP